MKKTGSIRMEIINEDDGYYWITFPGTYRALEVFKIPKSAVTNIHEEVDWSKVKFDILQWLVR